MRSTPHGPGHLPLYQVHVRILRSIFLRNCVLFNPALPNDEVLRKVILLSTPVTSRASGLHGHSPLYTMIWGRDRDRKDSEIYGNQI